MDCREAGGRRSRIWRIQGAKGLSGAGKPIRASPRPTILGQSIRISPRTMGIEKRKGSRGRKHLFPFRRRSPPLHRRELRMDGNHSAAGHACPKLENAPDAGAGDRIAAHDDLTAEIWHENDLSEPGAVATGFRMLKKEPSRYGSRF